MRNAITIPEIILDGCTKGIPGKVSPFPIGAVAEHGWNVLKGDLPLPCAVLRKSALDRNRMWMKRFLERENAVLCPHGKTTMSPELFALQFEDGAWGLTAATVQQIHTYRKFGVQRILHANQLVGKAEIEYVLGELKQDPGFDFYTLVDSPALVKILSEHADLMQTDLQVLIEVGQPGARSGIRNAEQATALCDAIAASPRIKLRGIETYEGIIQGANDKEIEAHIEALYSMLGTVASLAQSRGLFEHGPVILSGGGSAYYDMAACGIAAVPLATERLHVIRSGCYLTHDSKWLDDYFQRMCIRAEGFKDYSNPPEEAIEVWAYIHSIPEPGRGFATVGKRDVSYDLHLPVLKKWFRPGKQIQPHDLTNHKIVALNDQHAYIDMPQDSPLAVGDMVAMGISHPCTTFDKWRFMPVVNDDYTVISGISTWF